MWWWGGLRMKEPYPPWSLRCLRYLQFQTQSAAQLFCTFPHLVIRVPNFDLNESHFVGKISCWKRTYAAAVTTISCTYIKSLLTELVCVYSSIYKLLHTYVVVFLPIWSFTKIFESWISKDFYSVFKKYGFEHLTKYL